MHRSFVAALLLVFGAPGIATAGAVAVPEPETIALLAIGVAAIAITRWRRK